MTSLDRLRVLFDRYGESAEELGKRLGRSAIKVKYLLWGEHEITPRLKQEIDDLYNLAMRVDENTRIQNKLSGKG